MSEYIVALSDNSKTISISENAIDKDTTSIALVGHGQPNYGQPQNENFIHMLENFSSDEEPNNPLKGQLWFKQNTETNTYDLMICKKPNDDTPAEWDRLMKSSDGTMPVNPTTGDIWYDPTTHQFKVYDESLVEGTDTTTGWNTIGPEDVIHNQSEHTTTISNINNPTKQYVIDKKIFARDIYNSEEETSEHPGSLHLVTLKVLIKEVPNSGDGQETLKACAMIYKFVVRTISGGSGDNTSYSVSIFGAPDYEIIAKSDDLNFSTNLEVNGGNVVFSVTIDTASMSSETYFVDGFDMEVTRI